MGNAMKNALLPIVVSPERYAALTALVATNPDGEWTVDLETQEVTLPGGETFAFQLDPFSRTMILAGTDEIGYVRSQLPAIEAWEAGHPARVDTREGAAAR
jgi:3-isopropylmalate/(R)-2-methylmalate dehydratase small subunit